MAAGLVVAASWLAPVAAGSVAGPLVTVPLTATAGDPIDVTVTGCAGSATADWFIAFDSPTATAIAMTAGPVAGEHHGSFVAPDADVAVRVRCDGVAIMGDNNGINEVDVATTVTPALSYAPEHPTPGQGITMTVTGCPDQPAGNFSYSDIMFGMTFTSTGSDTWTAPMGSSSEDLWFSVHCRGWLGVQGGTVDVERPYLLWDPFSPGFGYVEPLTGLTGTDCPDGALPSVTFTAPGQQWTATDDATDAQGDWYVALPDLSGLAPDTEVTASAVCGSVTYESIVGRFGAEATTSTSTSTASTVPTTTTVPGALPAVPMPGTAAFTG